MYQTSAHPATTARPAPQVSESAWSTARHANRMDSEMAAHLRMHIGKVFADAGSWSDLKTRLRRLGFYLRAANSRVWLCDSFSRRSICSCGFLGFPSADLSTRFEDTAF